MLLNKQREGAGDWGYPNKKGRNKNKESQCLAQFPDLSNFRWGAHWPRKGLRRQRKGRCSRGRVYSMAVPPDFPPRHLRPLTWVTRPWEREWPGPLNASYTRSCVDTDTWRGRVSLCPQVRVSGPSQRPGKKWRPGYSPAHHGPTGSAVATFPDVRRVTGTDVLGSWSYLHTGSLDRLRGKNSQSKHGRVETLEMAPPLHGPSSWIQNTAPQGMKWRLVPLLKNS